MSPSKPQIKKAVIPAAGLGTRFLPITKSIPKEMLPIIDKPAIQFIIEEITQAGVEEILLIISVHKKSIMDYFTNNQALNYTLAMQNKYDQIDAIKQISSLAKISYVLQQEPIGLGHAISLAENFVNNEPFAVCLGDDVFVHDQNQNEKPVLAQIIEVYQQTQANVLTVAQVPYKAVSSYGIIAYQPTNQPNCLQVTATVEKPNPQLAPSNYAIFGRYIFNPTIFAELSLEKANHQQNPADEMQLTPAIDRLLKKELTLAVNVTTPRYDIGSKVGYVQATLAAAYQNPALKEAVQAFLRQQQKS